MNTGRRKANGIAIVAVTKPGVALGRRLSLLLNDSHLYLPQKFAAGPQAAEHTFSSPVREVVGEVFRRYRHLVLVMAVGIAVRLLAAGLRDKHGDPGVVVVDDGGKFAVSLLSGHVGGANHLAQRVASLLGARPVITTASYVNETIAVDLLGRELGWEIEDSRHLTRVSAALVNGEPVGVYQEAGEIDWWPDSRPLPDNVRSFASLEALHQSGCHVALVITDRVLDESEWALLPTHHVVYRPKSLVVGIGCNRGTKSTEIEEAVNAVLSAHRLSTRSIKKVATIDLKKDEPGLNEFARKYHMPVDYFGKEALRQARFPSRPSAMVLKHVGTPAVCESAAMLSGSSDFLIVGKERYNRTVTIAVARLAIDFRKKAGKLCLVGLGPGSAEHMTLRAREAISESEVVVGYKTYVKLIEPFLCGKEVIATGMGAEVARAKVAVNLARGGKKVSIVSSGDAGVYGMAGLVGEILRGQPGEKLAIEVIPGVTSMLAAAALLGAPITVDFAAISLSDYLVGWEDIARRLMLAAQGDFVIILYNPRSRKRRRQLAEAREIILQHRLPSTPVGIVTNAFREGQEVLITDLGHMLDCEVGMDTTVIIGNATTFSLDGWMVTPRGYGAKYRLTDEAST